MKASEALSLGRTITDTPRARDIDNCAIGMILNAHGVRKAFEFGPDGLFYNRPAKAVGLYPWMLTPAPVDFLARHPIDFSLQSAADSLYKTYYHWLVCAFNQNVMDNKTMTLDQLHDIIAEVEPACGICNEFDCSCHEVDTAVQSLVQERSGHVEEAFKNMEMAK